MEPVLMNLCINAREAMAGGGTLKITTEKTAAPACRPDAKETEASGNVCLRVSDTGCGIPPEITKHIFEPHFSDKPTGNGPGLGLLMVQAIVKNHGGTIECASEKGVGTEFKIVFPALMPKGDLSKKPVQAPKRQ